MSNQALEDRQASEADAKIALALGISADDYSLLETELEAVTSDDAVVAHDVYFKEGSDPTVLAKIEGAELGGFLRIGYIDFDSPDPWDE